MTPDDKSGGKRKNPWDRPAGNDSGDPQGWVPRPGRGGGEPPDIDALLRKAQENFRSVMPGNAGPGKIAAMGLLALLLLWAASGFYIVRPAEQAVIQRFGAWSRTQFKEGLGYRLPTPFESVTKVNVNEIRLISIGFVQSASGGRRNLSEESLMLTSDRNIVDLSLNIQWNIKSAEDYLFSVKDQENTIKKVAESAIREVAGQTEMFPIITNQRQQIADKAKEILQKNLDEYKSGVNITQFLIEKAELHPDVQATFQDVQSANQDAEDVQNRAEAYRQDILPKARGAANQILQEAEGYKQTVIARANGDAQRFNAVYEAYKSGEDVTKERMYIETMEGVLGAAQKIIMDSKGTSGVVPYLPLGRGAKIDSGANASSSPLPAFSAPDSIRQENRR